MSLYGSGLYGTALYGADPVQLGVDDLRVELFYSTQWDNRTSDVRTEPGIRWGRGCSSEDIEASPAWCDLTFDNEGGTYSPRNTGSSLYGLLGRNTPIRVGFGLPVVGRVATGSGGTTFANPALGTMESTGSLLAYAMATPTGNITTPAGYTGLTERDGAAFTARAARFPTQGTTWGGGTFTHSTTLTSWAACSVHVPGGTYVISDGSTADAGESPSAADTSALVAGDLVVAICAWTSDPYGRMGAPYFPLSSTPVEVYLVTDSGPSTGPRIAVWAWRHRAGSNVAGFVGALDGLTGAAFEIAVYSGASTYAPRFCGEIADWPLAWSKGEHDKTTSVRAGGVMRRMAQSIDVVSALRSALISQADLIAYWPMEDGEGATSFAAAIGGFPMAPVNGISPAQVDAVAGSLALPSFTGRGARGAVSPNNSAPWGFGGVVAVPSSGTAVGNNLLTAECAGGGGTISTFGIEYTSSSSITVKALFTDGTTASSVLSGGSFLSTFPNGIHGRQIFAYVALAQNGTGVDWSVSLINVTPTEPYQQVTSTGTIALNTVGPLAAVTAGVEAGTSATLGTNDVSIGHVFATGGAVLNFAISRALAARGYAGASVTETAMTVARDAGYRMAFVYPAADATMVAGKVEAASVSQQLRDLATTGQALSNDAAGFVGLEWRPLAAVVSRSPVFTFDYEGDTFTDPLRPVDDDRTTLNDVTVESTSGGMARVVVETGELGAQPGGAGRYAASFTLPTANATTARDLAGWMTGAGTLDAARWPEVGLEMSGDGNALCPMGAFSIGDTVRLTNLPSFTGPTSVDLVVTGFSEELDEALWRVTLICRLAGTYRALIWDDATFGVWADSAAPSVNDNRWAM